VPVLFEYRLKGRWYGRTPTNRIVFTDSEEDLTGMERQVKIDWTGPWSLVGSLEPVR